MRDADSRKNSSGRNSRRPGGRNDSTANRRRHAGSSGRSYGMSSGAQYPEESSPLRDDAPSHDIGAARRAPGNRVPDGRMAGGRMTGSSTASGRMSDGRMGGSRTGSSTPGSSARDSRTPGSRTGKEGRSHSGSSQASRARARATSTLRGLDTQRIRRFALAIAASYGAVLLFIVSLALIGIIVYGGGITPLPATIASLWMVFNAGSFGYNGTELGLMPLLPAMAMVGFIAWRIRREVADRISIRDVRSLAVSFTVTPLVLTVIAWLMLFDAARVLTRVKVPSLTDALGSTLLISLIALGLGMGPRLIRALLRRRKWPEWLLDAARLAARYIGWLWLAGLIAAVASMAIHASLFREAYAITANASEAIALTVLSILYLPNVAFAAAGILAGVPANIGTAEAGLFAVTPGTMPPLPVLAAFPQSYQSVAYGVLIVVPAAIAVAVVSRYVRSSEPENPYRVVVVAAVVAGVIAAALGWLTSGNLGLYGWSGTAFWLVGILVSMWLVVPGAVVVIAFTGLPRGQAYEPEAIARETFPSTANAPVTEGAAAAEAAEESAAEEGATEEGTTPDVVDGEVISAEDADGDAGEADEAADDAEDADGDAGEAADGSDNTDNADEAAEDADDADEDADTAHAADSSDSSDTDANDASTPESDEQRD